MMRKIVGIISVLFALSAPMAFSGGQDEQAGGGGSDTMTVGSASEQQAPRLRELVNSGDLPALADRLPENPKVRDVHETIGVYGGTINMAYFGTSDWNSVRKYALADGLVRWEPHPRDGLTPALAESWEWNEGRTMLTINLRRGVKWSDGHPFTTEDIAFKWYQIDQNEEIPEIPPMTTGGEPVELEVIDDYTVRFHFPVPLIFALQQDSFQYINDMAWPAHYFMQFHPDNTDRGWDYFRANSVEAPPAPQGAYFVPERPVLQAWKSVEYTPGQRLVLERNPYYWKVDPDGNQLPYVDRLVYDEIQDSEVFLLKILNGEIDTQSRHVTFANFTTMKENERQGDYSVGIHGSSRSFEVFFINRDTPKDELRPYLRNRDFRVALSRSLDRSAMNDLFFSGTQDPRSYTFTEGSQYYDAELASMYTEYDPEAARATFDELGLIDRDADGIREYENGDDVTITIWVDVSRQINVDLAEFAQSQWGNVGLNIAINAVERGQLWTQTRAPVGPRHDMVVWSSPGEVPLQLGGRWGAVDVVADSAASWWADSANRWRLSNGEEGEEPPETLKRVQDLWLQASAEPDADRRAELAAELNRIHAEQVYNIGTLTSAWPIVVKNNVRNVPMEGYILGNYVRGMASLRPEQFYIEQ